MQVNRSTRFKKYSALIAALMAVLGSGCEDKTVATEPVVAPTPETVLSIDPEMAEKTAALWQRGQLTLEQTLQAANSLHTDVQEFLRQPNADTFANARNAWHVAHESYLQFEIFTFLGHASPDLFGQLRQHNFNLHAWPITPGYLDYYQVYTDSGIVNDIALTISAEEVRKQHGFSDDTDVSIGFHALAYLLWGELGQRPAADYETQSQLSQSHTAAGMRVVDLPNNRRRTLLALVSQLLLDDLHNLQTHWQDSITGPAKYYLDLAAPSRVALWHKVATDFTVELQRRTPQLRANAPSEGTALEAPEVNFHNQFSGRSATALAHSLEGLRVVLFAKNSGLGAWFSNNSIVDLNPSTTALMDALKQSDVASADGTTAIDWTALQAQADGQLSQLIDALVNDATGTESENSMDEPIDSDSFEDGPLIE